MKKATIIAALLVLPLQALLAQDSYKYKQIFTETGAKKGTVTLEIPAGELQVKASAASLVEAQVQYSKSDWQPVFTSNKSTTEPVLAFSQKEMSNKNSNNVKNDWSVNLSKTTPLDLHIKMGAGQSTLNLQNSHINKLTMDAGAVSSSIDLRGSKAKNVVVNAGVGEVNLDLRGNWDHDVEVDVTGGIGDVSIRVPKNTGVRIKSSGLGSRNMGNLQKDGSTYTNAALGKSRHTLNIDVIGGLGSITVLQE